MVDAPGYGYAKGDSQELQRWGKMVNVYLDNSAGLHRVLLLLDSQHGVKEIDYMLMDLLEYKRTPFVVVFTKVDKLQSKDIHNVMDQSRGIQSKYNCCSPIFHLTSCLNGYGVEDLAANVAYMLQMGLVRESLEKL